MKALVFDGQARVRDVPAPKTKPGETLIHVTMAGICKTDVEIIAGYMDFRGILGHEFVGTVAASPDPALLGVRVVGEINAGCGACDYCRQDLQRHCPSRTVLGIKGRQGALAEYLTLPLTNLVAVPDTLSDEIAVFTEPVAAALEIMEQIRIEPSHTVAVIGDGKLGLLISMVLRLTGCDPVLVGKHPEKMALFSHLRGRTLPLDLFLQTDERFDVVVEASGNASGWNVAMKKVKPRGTVVLKSTYHGSLTFNPAALVIDEITVVGSRCGRFAPALKLLDLGLVDPAPLISGVFPLEQAEAALRKAQEAGAFKVLVRM
ncbi:MAG TPA: alcohol dehydrogenase catalytic domain-containing protein [Desulfomonilaceae bacterium]|nr:alcohol dehydrogenase catalytic domain-containing protein [Desulfomonilaceae bacterium]